MAYAASVATDNATERIEFDVFVSMRGRTRGDFVRPLAHALEARRLRPWYDESLCAREIAFAAASITGC